MARLSPGRILLGLSQYVRPSGLVLIPVFVVFPVACLDGAEGGRSRLGCADRLRGDLGTGWSVVWQYQRYGQFLALSTSNFDGWSLLVGLTSHQGQFNREDLALVGAESNTVDFRNRTYRLAFDRLRANPGAVLELAAPKFGIMWGDNTYGVGWTMAPDVRRHPRVVAAVTLISQVGYAIILVMAVGCLWLRRRERDPVILLICLCLGAVALSEMFLEVQPGTTRHSSRCSASWRGSPQVGWWNGFANGHCTGHAQGTGDHTLEIRDQALTDQCSFLPTGGNLLPRSGAFDKTENRGILLLL